MSEHNENDDTMPIGSDTAATEVIATGDAAVGDVETAAGGQANAAGSVDEAVQGGATVAGGATVRSDDDADDDADAGDDGDAGVVGEGTAQDGGAPSAVGGGFALGGGPSSGPAAGAGARSQGVPAGATGPVPQVHVVPEASAARLPLEVRPAGPSAATVVFGLFPILLAVVALIVGVGTPFSFSGFAEGFDLRALIALVIAAFGVLLIVVAALWGIVAAIRRRREKKAAGGY